VKDGEDRSAAIAFGLLCLVIYIVVLIEAYNFILLSTSITLLLIYNVVRTSPVGEVHQAFYHVDFSLFFRELLMTIMIAGISVITSQPRPSC
jgi:hypothetical protein